MAAGVAPADTRPNVIVMVADDLGWADVGFHGNTTIDTPSLDRIAREGVQLDRFYTTPICSPTRAALMTGRDPIRLGVAYSTIMPWQNNGVHPNETFLPELFLASGYQTAMVGKWHLGNSNAAYWPQERGFDSFYGHLNGGVGYFDHVFSGGLDWQKNGVTLREEGYTTELIKNAAIKRIENRTDEDAPLFLLVSFNAIHTPIEEPENASAKHQGRATLLRMISSLDAAVGEVVDSLMLQPWGENTVIIFASDNGGSSPKPWLIELLIPPMRDGYSSNGQLKQGKGSVFEGGIRVPAAIWWPGNMESRKPLEQVAHIADILPTLTDIAGAGIPAVDGRSIKDALIKNTQLQQRPIVVANFDSEAIIDWPWKVVREGSFPITPEFLKSDTWYLYNIESDPSELDDLKTQFPEKFEQMRSALLTTPRRKSVEFSTDQSWDTFGGEETRPPWAEAAIR